MTRRWAPRRPGAAIVRRSGGSCPNDVSGRKVLKGRGLVSSGARRSRTHAGASRVPSPEWQQSSTTSRCPTGRRLRWPAGPRAPCRPGPSRPVERLSTSTSVSLRRSGSIGQSSGGRRLLRAVTAEVEDRDVLRRCRVRGGRSVALVTAAVVACRPSARRRLRSASATRRAGSLRWR